MSADDANGGSGDGNGRDESGRFLPGHAHGFQPGHSGNASGSSEKARFRAAVRRALRRRMAKALKALEEAGHELTGEENELDLLGEEVVDLALTKGKAAPVLLKEVWAREDGPHETRITGPNGEAVVPLVLFGIDAEAMRLGRDPDEPAAAPELPAKSSD